jgi:predicted membrane-bound spermidine synthase
MQTRRAFLPAVLLLFTASGFAGLIYESIWSHYLKLFLGHAAYAQTLVLAIFMGGMAAGAWIASRFSSRWKEPLVAYAVTEALVGALSLAFHDVFVATSAWAYADAIPALGSPLAVQAFKWTLAAVLILPQSVLLGMTFPLMTAGVLRMQGERAGYAIAMLYFTNSFGAAVGVLASGFYFIAAVGLPGTLIAAAIVNLAVAGLVMLLRPRRAPAAVPVALAAAPPGTVKGLRLLLTVSALTGLSSFFYEIGWIRMLSLLLGASTHSFELMLSAFILGIACGGLWVRRRIDAALEPVRTLAYMQLAMGAAALATLPLYNETFVVMQGVMKALSRSDAGYVAFNLSSHLLSMAIMFPASFFAGTTLPLITAALLRRRAGERAVGQVYAANTAGAIAGVVLAVHVGLPLLGLKGTIVAGAAIDLALGVVLLAKAGQRAPRLRVLGAALAACALAGFAVLGVQFNALSMTSGVYRIGVLQDPQRQEVQLQIDGKTATVSVVRNGKARSLLTNGKPDGAVNIEGEPNDDEIMMGLLGALPQFFAPEARRVANIGFGTGMSTHVLLASRTIETVDTVEIEPAMVRAASLFRPLNARAFDDPRSHVQFEDAKTYFSSHQSLYDVIVSEPSNPWVSGVASLFSTEFYRDVRRHLRPGGLLMQWVQTYEMSPTLLATILQALGENFADYELWTPSHGDVIIVAANGGKVPRPDASAFANPRLAAELGRLGIRNMDDLLLHRLGGSAVLAPYFASYGVPPNSDFNPILDLNAPRTRFLRVSADDMAHFHETGLPLLEWFDPQATLPRPDRITRSAGWLRRTAYAHQAKTIANYFRTGDETLLPAIPAPLGNQIVVARAAFVDCRLPVSLPVARDALGSIAWVVNVNLPRDERVAFWRRLLAGGCMKQPAVRRWLDFHAAVGANAPEMAEAASAILDSGEAIPPHLMPSLVGARMAGFLLRQHPGNAQRVLLKYRGQLGKDDVTQTMFRLLIGQVDRQTGAVLKSK